jgi:hypothetical protein
MPSSLVRDAWARAARRGSSWVVNVAGKEDKWRERCSYDLCTFLLVSYFICDAIFRFRRCRPGTHIA